MELQTNAETCLQNIEPQKNILNEYEQVVKDCDLSRQMQEILSTYLLFERYPLLYLLASTELKILIQFKVFHGGKCSESNWS